MVTSFPFRRVRGTRQDVVLSVVVPSYNVADFLAGSLDSILRQPVSGVEVILVDDGSTDGSAEIAADYARRHSSIHLMTQPNSGVSIARNNALTQCRGEFLTFVDPDDELPEDAWTTMLATLRRTGSDFVVGAAERLEGNRRFVTPLMQRNHTRDRFGIRIEDQPLMLADIFVWNKIFRTSFWREAGITFPERTRYQDQPALTHAFLAARAFDVLTEVVYDWRVRPTKNSATQRRRELSNLIERVNTKRATIDLVTRYGNAEVTRVLFREILPIDMWEHFRSVPGCSDDYWELLHEAVREFWNDDTVPFHDTVLPVQQRLMGWLVTQGLREDLERLIELIDSTPGGLPVTDGQVEHPWRDHPSLPATLLRRQP